MRKVTREQYKKYVNQIAAINGIEAIDVAARFTVEPSVSQTLEEKIQESSSFLKKSISFRLMNKAVTKSAWGLIARLPAPPTPMKKTVNPSIQPVWTSKATCVPRPILIPH